MGKKKQIKTLTNELKKSTEINSLKSGQLNDAKQKNISLEADVSSFKAKAEAVEIQAAEIADDLTIKLEKKVDQYADQQQTNSGKDAVAFQEDYENLQRITF